MLKRTNHQLDKTLGRLLAFGIIFFFCLTVPPSRADFGPEGDGSSANTPSGGQVKPSQMKIKDGQATNKTEVYLGDEFPDDIDSLLPESEKEFKYVGIWHRQGTYAGGMLVSDEPATLQLLPKAFFSDGTCSVSGSLEVEAGTITMTTESTNCINHAVGTKTISTYEIPEDGKSMKLINTQYGTPVIELYVRN